MNLPKRLVNLLGMLAVMVALVAGLLLVALPVYLGSRDVETETEAVAQSNQVTALQIDGLAAQQGNLPTLKDELSELRGEITDLPRLDAVSALVVRSAAASDSKLTSFNVGEPAPYAPPAGVPLTDRAAPAPAPSSEPGTPQQVQVAVGVTASTQAEISRFVDELREGPRLVQVVGVKTGVRDDLFEATVTAIAFIQE